MLSMNKDVKTCKYCGKMLKDLKNESFCSRKCSSLFRRDNHYSEYEEKIKERILRNIEIFPSGCWIWKSFKSKSGYAEITWKGEKKRTNRISFEVFKDKIPTGMYVCHTCDNPLCVNPDHLYIGTHQDNIDDKLKKGRQSKGKEIGRSKLDEEKVNEIRRIAEKEEFSHERIGEIFGVSQSCISRIVKRLTWKHI